MGMTVPEAWELWKKAKTALAALRDEFPCEACDGEGGDDPENTAYPEPCPECWGRGFIIPDEEDE